jgi:hypothetical protein
VIKACALLAERAARWLDTAPSDSIANAPIPAGRQGGSSAVGETPWPEVSKATGGLPAAVALVRKGTAAEVYEQAPVLESVALRYLCTIRAGLTAA